MWCLHTENPQKYYIFNEIKQAKAATPCMWKAKSYKDIRDKLTMKTVHDSCTSLIPTFSRVNEI